MFTKYGVLFLEGKEMKAQELRIGNLVNYSETQSIFKVIGIHKFGLDVENDIETTYIEYDQFASIPLTEQWLLDFGAEKFPSGDKSYILNGLLISWAECRGVFIYNGIELKHVHTLQNLIYALTGEELELNKK